MDVSTQRASGRKIELRARSSKLAKRSAWSVMDTIRVEAVRTKNTLQNEFEFKVRIPEETVPAMEISTEEVSATVHYTVLMKREGDDEGMAPHCTCDIQVVSEEPFGVQQVSLVDTLALPGTWHSKAGDIELELEADKTLLAFGDKVSLAYEIRNNTKYQCKRVSVLMCDVLETRVQGSDRRTPLTQVLTSRKINLNSGEHGSGVLEFEAKFASPDVYVCGDSESLVDVKHMLIISIACGRMGLHTTQVTIPCITYGPPFSQTTAAERLKSFRLDSFMLTPRS
mmetsp:Transcript_2205/g.3672  ORF Transcript_2205/g.3672 Transcript_2205/m.3672 type:complete len:283 (+) Transcript_2205:128-976(+)